jgi:hypothetical protein
MFYGYLNITYIPYLNYDRKFFNWCRRSASALASTWGRKRRWRGSGRCGGCGRCATYARRRCSIIIGSASCAGCTSVWTAIGAQMTSCGRNAPQAIPPPLLTLHITGIAIEPLCRYVDGVRSVPYWSGLAIKNPPRKPAQIKTKNRLRKPTQNVFLYFSYHTILH